MPNRTLGSEVTVLNPALGINVYRGALSEPNCDKYIDILERNLSGTDSAYEWGGAKVTNSADVDNYARNAQDFKVSSDNLGPRTEDNAELYDMHEEIFNRLRMCMNDYSAYWGVGIQFYEAFNFVKYDGAGTQFRIHADHGPTYVATISAVLYLNDDYEGGELWFPRFGVDLKPKKGDIAIFPSTFIYEHASKEMISGTKYSIVVMTDYHDRDGVNQRVSPVVEDYKLKY
tara:strand:+ start:701 stop:1390 length:690 start_codon:yes stop_codon:yes gene_type:complete